MKILVTGCKGQVGTELMRQGSTGGHEMIGLDSAALDITDARCVEQAVVTYAPEVVINAAAYTAVDKAERDEARAYAVNRDGAAHLAAACQKLNIPLVHYSTDYVFDGAKQVAYHVDDPVAPLGVYGQSKLVGERAIQETCSQYLILRTSWVFSSHGNNFVKTMLRLGAEREQLGVVADQYGKPTAAAEIARVTLAILQQGAGQWGIYHLAQPEATSWYGFAQAIFDEAHRQGVALQVENVRAIATTDYPTPARRPANSELECKEIEETFNVTIRLWKESLADVVEELREESLATPT
jgi:dTDP-4-dehydrorhamnose reductase